MSISRTQMQSLNGKRSSSQRIQQEPSPPQHDDLIKYIYDSWSMVNRELESFSQNGTDSNKGLSSVTGTGGQIYLGGPSVQYYKEQEPNPQLKDFEPFDLEAWWGKKLVQNITIRTQSS